LAAKPDRLLTVFFILALIFALLFFFPFRKILLKLLLNLVVLCSWEMSIELLRMRWDGVGLAVGLVVILIIIVVLSFFIAILILNFFSLLLSRSGPDSYFDFLSRSTARLYLYWLEDLFPWSTARGWHSYSSSVVPGPSANHIMKLLFIYY
jgi:hypothetical protein